MCGLVFKASILSHRGCGDSAPVVRQDRSRVGCEHGGTHVVQSVDFTAGKEVLLRLLKLLRVGQDN